MNDYLPMLNGCILADIIIILMVYYTNIFDIVNLKKWYEKYRLSAVIADVLILVIGLIITRYIFKVFKLKYNIFKFIAIVLAVQITHDFLFYLFFSMVPRGVNNMLDLFKDYASEIGGSAIFGDSFMMVLATLLSLLFTQYSMNSNIILCICLCYLIPYVIYIK
tara:strand:- start:414 stop:905 length:492 start_codon:yes stop_codon:yes gene_type:complete